MASEAQRRAARKHYEANKEAMKARAVAHKNATRQRLRVVVAEAKSVPCMDCGQQHPPYVMDFDHLGDKVQNISDMANRAVSEQRLRSEMAKCEIVCANCHRIRTHLRQM